LAGPEVRYGARYSVAALKFLPSPCSALCSQRYIDGHFAFSLMADIVKLGQRCQVQSRVRRWLQLIGCTTLLMVASNFRGPGRVGESGVGPRRSLRQTRAR